MFTRWCHSSPFRYHTVGFFALYYYDLVQYTRTTLGNGVKKLNARMANLIQHVVWTHAQFAHEYFVARECQR